MIGSAERHYQTPANQKRRVQLRPSRPTNGAQPVDEWRRAVRRADRIRKLEGARQYETFLRESFTKRAQRTRAWKKAHIPGYQGVIAGQ